MVLVLRGKSSRVHSAHQSISSSLYMQPHLYACSAHAFRHMLAPFLFPWCLPSILGFWKGRAGSQMFVAVPPQPTARLTKYVYETSTSLCLQFIKDFRYFKPHNKPRPCLFQSSPIYGEEADSRKLCNLLEVENLESGSAGF